MIKSCINKRKSREITSMQKRKNSSLGGHEFTLAIKSLYEEKGNDGYLWSEAQTINVVCYEDNYFPKRKFKLFNSLYHSVYLVFQHVCSIVNMFAVRYLWKTTVTKHSDK